jgi:D-alanyl-D-alanine carboxypeptidase
VAGRNLSWVAVHDPSQYFGTVLKETLAQGGIEVAGPIEESPQSIDEGEGLQGTGGMGERPPSTLAACNQPSQNFYAEMIFRTSPGR